MRPIKFRGESMGSDFVYGLLSQKVIRHSGRISWSIATGLKQSENIPVIEETIAQLVGYDKNGREVYEGDKLIDDDGQEFVASLQGSVRWLPADKSICADMPDSIKTVPFDFAQQYTPLTLKEQSS